MCVVWIADLSRRAGTLTVGMCDLVTFAALLNESGSLSANWFKCRIRSTSLSYFWVRGSLNKFDTWSLCPFVLGVIRLIIETPGWPIRSCHVLTQNAASSPSDKQIKGTMYMPEEYARIFAIGHPSRSKICNNSWLFSSTINAWTLLQILDREECPIENIRAYSSGMYIVPLICSSEGDDATFCVNTWHERIGHLGVSMMKQIIPSTKGHKLQVSNLFKGMKPCEFRALGLEVVGSLKPLAC